MKVDREADGLVGGGAAASLLRDAEKGARLKSVGLMVAGVTLFSGLDTASKLAARELPVLEIAWFRYAVHFLIAAVLLNPLTSPAAWRVRRVWPQVARAVLLGLSTVLNVFALRHLQLAQTVSIMFLGPLLITALSVLLLSERIGPHRIGAILAGFGGILLVTRPGLTGFDAAMLYSLGSVLCGAVYALLTRHLAGSETPGSMILVLAFVPALMLTPTLPAVWVTPDRPALWLLLAATGFFGGLGHYLLILAHRYAPASVLAPYGYAQIVTMIAFGYVVFGDVPSGWTLSGAAIVVTSGLYLLSRERLPRQ